MASLSHPAMSADGRFVAFVSRADNLAPGDTNGAYDVFMHDRFLGTTTAVSVNNDGAFGNANALSYLIISDDGRHVAFESQASNLHPLDDDHLKDIFVRDLQTGTTALVSVNRDRSGNGNADSDTPVLSADGRFVAFRSDADNLVADDLNGASDVFVLDRDADGDGMFDEPDDTTTLLVSVSRTGGSGNGASQRPLISDDGQWIAFVSDANDLELLDVDANPDIFIRYMAFGPPASGQAETKLISVNYQGTGSAEDDRRSGRR